MDGNIARMSKSKSLFGAMFDGWVDEIINLLFVISIAKSISYTHFIFSLGICLVKIISSYTQTRYLYLFSKTEKSVTNSINKKSNSFKKIASILMSNFVNLNSQLTTIFLILMVLLDQLSLWFFIYAIYLILFSTLTLLKTLINSLKI